MHVMKYRLTPICRKILNVLTRYGFEIVKITGDHIKINKYPPLRRPIILVNEKKLSNAVRLNLIREAEEGGVQREELEELF